MNHKQKLLAFFEVENKRDWEACRGFIHPDVKWILHSIHVKQEHLHIKNG